MKVGKKENNINMNETEIMEFYEKLQRVLSRKSSLASKHQKKVAEQLNAQNF